MVSTLDAKAGNLGAARVTAESGVIGTIEDNSHVRLVNFARGASCTLDLFGAEVWRRTRYCSDVQEIVRQLALESRKPRMEVHDRAVAAIYQLAVNHMVLLHS